MTAADRVAGIPRKTGGLPIRALIGHRRLIIHAVCPVNRARANRAWLARRATWASERVPKLAMPPPTLAALRATVTLVRARMPRLLNRPPPAIAMLRATVTLRSVAVPLLNRPPPFRAELPVTVTL